MSRSQNLRRWLRWFAHSMTRYIKCTLLVVAGLCWLLFALAIGFFLFKYLAEGAGLQVIGFFGLSSITILIGLVHVVGFGAAAYFCFVSGVGLCVHGLEPGPEPQGKDCDTSESP